MGFSDTFAVVGVVLIIAGSPSCSRENRKVGLPQAAGAERSGGRRSLKGASWLANEGALR
jgi:hypothetical protein